MKKVVFVDMDDVLVELVQAWINSLNKTHKTNIQLEDIRSWDITGIIASLGLGITAEEVLEGLKAPGLFREAEIVEDAQPALIELEQFYRIVILTSVRLDRENAGDIVQQKMDWLKKYFPWIVEKGDVIVTYQKGLTRGNLLIDDGPHNIRNFPGKTICFDRPWNREESLGLRGKNWKQIVKLCKELL